MNCRQACDFVHKIHLVDERPFRLPYHRVPPSQYEKLRTALNQMEEKGIICKSSSEYASPLVLVWKKNGDLRICTEIDWLKWINKHTWVWLWQRFVSCASVQYHSPWFPKITTVEEYLDNCFCHVIIIYRHDHFAHPCPRTEQDWAQELSFVAVNKLLS